MSDNIINFPAAVENAAAEKKPKKNTQSRNYCMCFHNIEKTGFDHNRIKGILLDIPSLSYFCIADEIGLETQRLHTHVYIHCKNPILFSTLRNKFADADVKIETCTGTAEENRDYVFKCGKWEDDPKADTKIENSQEEWGTFPKSRQGRRSDWESVREMIKENKSDWEIIESFPHMIPHLKKIQEYRNLVLEGFIDTQIEKNPPPENIIIFGAPELGKSTYAWNIVPRSQIYTVTNPINPFDGFVSGKHTTIIYDEFSDDFYNIRDINQWFDRFYQKFKCRYYDRWLTQNRNIIITNKNPEDFWKDIQRNEPLVWQAFCRRVHKVLEFYELGKYKEYDGMNAYMNRKTNFLAVPKEEKTPFDSESPMPFDD